MIELGIVVVILLMLWLSSAAQQVERANEDVKANVEAAGVTYDPARAGQPLRDGCGLILLTIVLAMGAVAVLTALVPLS